MSARRALIIEGIFRVGDEEEAENIDGILTLSEKDIIRIEPATRIAALEIVILLDAEEMRDIITFLAGEGIEYPDDGDSQ